MTKEYKVTADALIEEKKFINFLRLDGWPQKMATFKTNLLCTTILDEQKSESRGSTTKMLASLLSAYQRHFLKAVAAKETKWDASHRNSRGAHLHVFRDNHYEKARAKGGDIGKKDESDVTDTKLSKETHAIDDIDVSRNNNNFCHNLAWKSFLTNVWTEDFSPFDTIL